MDSWLRYATTADGLSIAYTVLGSGPPLVRITGGLWDHAQGYQRIEPFRRQLERLAARFTHIQYDARGTGLSQRGIADFSLEAQLSDLQAVIEASGVDKVNLLSHFTGGFAGMAYAARNPDRVSNLILFRPHLRGTDYFNERAIRAMAAYREMAAEDWWGYLSTVTNRAVRFDNPELARQLAAVYNESMTPETIRRFQDDYSQIDVSDLPERIACPTLIVVDTARGAFSDDPWREVAARIPNVSLVMVRGALPLAYLDETTDAILSFLGQEAGTTARDDGGEALQVLLYMKVEQPGPSYEATLREMTRARGGLRFGPGGEGYIAAFRSAQMALETAVDIQNVFTTQGDPAGLRIGVDAVDQVVAGASGLGVAGQRAALIGNAAVPGEVLVTDVVRQLVTGKGFLFAARDAGAYEGSDEPVHVYELRWRS
ncbi:MAG TPA: alpha/beta fold hydrolase [Dehalococcoidia bacterium]|nr:alpha/beta fold hydrolase [Dehalococcoidia bacterium]